MFFKKLFCNHNYKLIAKRTSNYTSDYILFSDLGFYDDYLYECTKCTKRKIDIKQNEKHPLYRKWERLEDK